MDTGKLHAGSRWRVVVLAPLCTPLLLLTACESESRVVRSNPYFTGLPGAQALPPVTDAEASSPPDSPDAGADRLVIENPDGSKTLVLKTMGHLVANLSRTLTDGEDELLYDQIISDETKAHYRAEYKDPHEALTFLKDHRRDVLAMLARMPMAEHSPSVTLLNAGPNRFRLTLTGPAARDVNLTTLWVVFEDGKWRLWWVT